MPSRYEDHKPSVIFEREPLRALHLRRAYGCRRRIRQLADIGAAGARPGVWGGDHLDSHLGPEPPCGLVQTLQDTERPDIQGADTRPPRLRRGRTGLRSTAVAAVPRRRPGLRGGCGGLQQPPRGIGVRGRRHAADRIGQHRQRPRAASAPPRAPRPHAGQPIRAFLGDLTISCQASVKRLAAACPRSQTCSATNGDRPEPSPTASQYLLSQAVFALPGAGFLFLLGWSTVTGWSRPAWAQIAVPGILLLLGSSLGQGG